MVVEPVSIRIFGREHILRPLEVEQFFKITSSWSELDALKNDKTVETNVLLDKYHEIISVALPTIKRADFDKMSISQIGAMMQIVCETVTGKTFGDTEKKTLIPMAQLRS